MSVLFANPAALCSFSSFKYSTIVSGIVRETVDLVCLLLELFIRHAEQLYKNKSAVRYESQRRTV